MLYSKVASFTLCLQLRELGKKKLTPEACQWIRRRVLKRGELQSGKRMQVKISIGGCYT
jgi:hypothetical protein